MEKCNAVREGATPCKTCSGGHSEYECPACVHAATEKRAEEHARLDPEKLSEDHK